MKHSFITNQESGKIQSGLEAITVIFFGVFRLPFRAPPQRIRRCSSWLACSSCPLDRRRYNSWSTRFRDDRCRWCLFLLKCLNVVDQLRQISPRKRTLQADQTSFCGNRISMAVYAPRGHRGERKGEQKSCEDGLHCLGIERLASIVLRIMRVKLLILSFCFRWNGNRRKLALRGRGVYAYIFENLRNHGS